MAGLMNWFFHVKDKTPVPFKCVITNFHKHQIRVSAGSKLFTLFPFEHRVTHQEDGQIFHASCPICCIDKTVKLVKKEVSDDMNEVSYDNLPLYAFSDSLDLS